MARIRIEAEGGAVMVYRDGVPMEDWAEVRWSCRRGETPIACVEVTGKAAVTRPASCSIEVLAVVVVREPEVSKSNPAGYRRDQDKD